MKRTLRLNSIFAACMIAGVAVPASAFDMEWHQSADVQTGTGTFAPYFLSSNQNGITGVSPHAVYLQEGLRHALNDSTRFSYGFGVDLNYGYFSKLTYDKWDEQGVMYTHKLGPGIPVVQQLYGEIKYRSLYLMAGMKEYDRSLFDSPLGVGDYTLSRNARPIPQVRAGFYDFVDIPLTQGWVQIQGELAYGKFVDDGWVKSQFGHEFGHICTNVWFHHKRCYFRTKPEMPFSVTVGMQHAAQFGGTSRTYSDGKLVSTMHNKHGLKQFLKIFLPIENSNPGDYYDGNSLGSWDLVLRYRFPEGHQLKAFMQHPWEDGSGIGFQNGFDGIYGLEYIAPQKGWVDRAMVEFIDFTNQSGPMHWFPGENQGTGVTTGQATGADQYYYNYCYTGWSNYGMVLGTPFIKSPIYNLDGYPNPWNSRVRGFQAGISGSPAPRLDYRLLVAYRTSWGSAYDRIDEQQRATSAMLAVDWKMPYLEGLSFGGAVAFDAGSLYGDNFGVKVNLSYVMPLKF